MADEPQFSLITACKDRLHHLKETLPQNCRLENTEVIVVDYDCPQKTREFVRSEFPEVKVVEVDDRPTFNASIARNLGARVASGSSFIFVDADIALSTDLVRAASQMPSDKFGTFDFLNDVRGTCVVSREAFDAIGGYDEVMEGYCGEDLDFYYRLRLVGYDGHVFAKDYVSKVIGHSNFDRSAVRGDGRKLSFTRGKIYRELKNLLMRLELKIDIDAKIKNTLWERVKDLVNQDSIFKEGAYIELPLPALPVTPLIKNVKIDRAIRLYVSIELE
jgi:glycosyltransferase involved in cell wall biosynthesis